LNDFGLAPKIWGKVLVSLGKSHEGCFDKVLSSSGMTRSTGITIIDTCELKEFLRNWSSDNTGSTRCWDKFDSDGGTLSGNFSWNSMDISDLVTPIASSDWNKLEFGCDQSSLDCNLNFLCDLHSESDMTVLVSNDNDSLETSSLSSHSLLLNGDNFHNFIRELDLLGAKEILNNT
jgi:hypothetical protein